MSFFQQIRKSKTGFEHETWKSAADTEHVVVCSSEMPQVIEGQGTGGGVLRRSGSSRSRAQCAARSCFGACVWWLWCFTICVFLLEQPQVGWVVAVGLRE